MLTPEEQEIKIQEKLDKYIEQFDNVLKLQTEFPFYIRMSYFDDQSRELQISSQYVKLLQRHYKKCGWKIKIYCNCWLGSFGNNRSKHKSYFACNRQDVEYNSIMEFSFTNPLTKFWRKIKKYILSFFEYKVPTLPERKTAYRD